MHSGNAAPFGGCFGTAAAAAAAGDDDEEDDIDQQEYEKSVDACVQCMHSEGGKPKFYAFML
jgi:hypothetical protein